MTKLPLTILLINTQYWTWTFTTKIGKNAREKCSLDHTVLFLNNSYRVKKRLAQFLFISYIISYVRTFVLFLEYPFI